MREIKKLKEEKYYKQWSQIELTTIHSLKKDFYMISIRLCLSFDLL